MPLGFQFDGIRRWSIFRRAECAEFITQISDTILVFARLRVEVLGTLTTKIDFLLSQMIWPGLRDLQLLLQLLNLGTLVRNDFLELASVTPPALGLGLEAL